MRPSSLASPPHCPGSSVLAEVSMTYARLVLATAGPWPRSTTARAAEASGVRSTSSTPSEVPPGRFPRREEGSSTGRVVAPGAGAVEGDERRTRRRPGRRRPRATGAAAPGRRSHPPGRRGGRAASPPLLWRAPWRHASWSVVPEKVNMRGPPSQVSSGPDPTSPPPVPGDDQSETPPTGHARIPPMHQSRGPTPGGGRHPRAGTGGPARTTRSLASGSPIETRAPSPAKGRTTMPSSSAAAAKSGSGRRARTRRSCPAAPAPPSPPRAARRPAGRAHRRVPPPAPAARPRRPARRGGRLRHARDAERQRHRAQRARERLRPHGVADPESGQPVGLGEGPGEQHVVVAAVGRHPVDGVGRADELDVRLVDDDQDVGRDLRQEGVELGLGDGGPGRVVGGADQHHPGPVGDRGRHGVEVVAAVGRAPGPGPRWPPPRRPRSGTPRRSATRRRPRRRARRTPGPAGRPARPTPSPAPGRTSGTPSRADSAS